MKKLLFILFILVPSLTYSQIIKDVGLKIGGTLSAQQWESTSLSNQIKFNTDLMAGFNAGIFFQSQDYSIFNILFEVNFIQKSTAKDNIINIINLPDGIAEDWNVNLNYLNLAIMLKPKINLGIFAPYVMVGPEVDMELSKSTETPKVFYDEFKKTRPGLRMGFGSEINLGTLRLLAEFVYDSEFDTLYDKNEIELDTYSYDIRFGIFF
ncbi:MAG: hypothetical protein CR986_06520 [Ignavibacteriae bacterium]|nr:MAG: hypothetical protein CR986_06520 [Ignavibacteriota bacterium]